MDDLMNLYFGFAMIYYKDTYKPFRSLPIQCTVCFVFTVFNISKVTLTFMELLCIT